MFGFFIIENCLTFHVYQAMCSLFQNHSLSVVILWSPGPCDIMWSHWSQQNKAQKQTRISTLNSLLTVQFNVPQKFKPNPELLKTCVNAMNTL